MGFYEAKDFCANQGMDLPPILNESQNNLIYCELIKYSILKQINKLKSI
jgi:hypothetical protein